MRFEKWQALGNDYLIVERDELPVRADRPRACGVLCDGHFGVFADGVLLLSPPDDARHVADLRIFNPDGSEAELSGNGAREAILYLRRRGWTDRDEFSIGTAAGEIRPDDHRPRRAASTWAMRRSAPATSPPGRPTASPSALDDVAAERRLSGLPARLDRQPAVRDPRRDPDELELLDLALLGPPIEAHALFPNRTNVSWYAELDRTAPTARGSARASSSAGWGRRCPPAPAPCGAAVAYLLAGRTRPPGRRRSARA